MRISKFKASKLLLMKKILTAISLLFVAAIATAQTVSIIPQPRTIKQPLEAGAFSITPATVIVADAATTKSVSFLTDYLQRFYQYKLKVVKSSPSPNAIRILAQKTEVEADGGYIVDINSKGIYINGNDENAVFYGIQTLIQLLQVPGPDLKKPLNEIKVPFLTVEDAPRFAYRGMHLDVTRHFFPISFVKKYIDYLAMHKLNKFHWHLTDDQGWRIEIKKYPKLTQVGGWRNGTIIGRYPGTGNDKLKYGGFYTQAEIKEVVKYAADRYIDVIPEIEMPGHASAAIAAYPQLSCFPDEPTTKYFPKDCEWFGDVKGKQVQQTWGVFDDVFCAGNEKTFSFLQDVLDEVLTLFPSKFIHVGGDECPKENWKRCNKCQLLLKKQGLKDEHELQSYFIQRMEKYLNNKGRTLIGWDEILEGGLAPNAVVMSWRGEAGGIQAAQESHNVIMSPGNPVYFDHTQSENEDSVTIGGFNPIEKVYAYEPIPAKLSVKEAKYILGAQANVWTEYMKNTSKVEYMIFPRMSALSEILWSEKEDKNWGEFEKKLMMQFKRYDLWKANYSKAFFDLKAKILPTEDNVGVYWLITSKNKGDLNLGRWAHDREAFEEILKTDTSLKIKIFHSNNYYAEQSGKGFISFADQQFHFNKATGKKITLTKSASDKYPGDGAFTLVNGVQNEKGMSKTKEYIGFNAADCEAFIDFGKTETISTVIIHSLHHKGSWIWRPQTLQIFVLEENGNYKSVGLTDDFKAPAQGIKNGTMTISFPATNTKAVKVLIKNWGEIPAGEHGAGSKAWLFVDEIEVN